METTNTPDEGTGFETTNDVADHIEKLMDSSKGTPSKVDAETETDSDDEVSNTSEIEDNSETNSDVDQSEIVDDEAEISEDGDQVEPEHVEIQEDATFVIDGNTVTGLELKKGYLRQSDYTKKLQDVAELKKHYDVSQYDQHEVRAQLQNHVDNFKRQLAAEFAGFQFPDLAAIAQEDPALAYQLEKEMQRKDALVKKLFDTEQAIAAQNAAYQNQIAEEAKIKAKEYLLQNVPEFRDPKTARPTLDKIENVLYEKGYTYEEVKSIQDPRIVEFLLDAVKYRETKRKVPAAVRHMDQKPALTMPGSGSSRNGGDNPGIKAAHQRVKASGHVNDVADLLSKYFI